MYKVQRYRQIFLIGFSCLAWTTKANAVYQTTEEPPTPTAVVLQVVVEPISGTLPLQVQFESQTTSTPKDYFEPLVVGLLAIIGTAVGAFLGAYYERRSQDQRWKRERRQKRYQNLEALLVEVGKVAHHARFVSLELPRENQLAELGEQIAELQANIRGMEFSDAYARVTDQQLLAHLDELELQILALPLSPTSLDETRLALQTLAERLNATRSRLDAVLVSREE